MIWPKASAARNEGTLQAEDVAKTEAPVLVGRRLGVAPSAPRRVHQIEANAMFYHPRKDWEIDSDETTLESRFLTRRSILAAGAASIVVGLGAGSDPSRADEQDAATGLYPAQRNETYMLDRELTPENINTNYNNFYEFTTSKHVDADALKTHPWTLTIDGLVEKPMTVDVYDLVKSIGVEERLYRHRCVEAWSMAVPWTGFPLSALVERAKPLGSAKFVRFESFLNKKIAPGQRSFMPWPYVEGLTIAEATNDLAFMVTGAYGKPLPKVMGAPLRLATPWKYGFKSAKSIVKVSFVEERPDTFWQTLGPDEYGFWANVNPEVPHPRWSQARETFLTTGEQRPTLLYNGYGEQVAGLYKGLEKEPLFM